MPTLHGMTGSGNCHKPALLMRQPGIDFRWQKVDIIHGGSRTGAFLALNPNGKVPLLEFEDGRVLAESNAMLCYLADGTPLYPQDRWQRAQILQWCSSSSAAMSPTSPRCVSGCTTWASANRSAKR